MNERLQKIISNSGYCSRREAEKLIKEGRVLVNGNVVTELGTKFSPKALIEIDGVKINKDEKVYFLLYKPYGVVSTSKDEKGRKTVVDLIDTKMRVYPVGRLDYDTTGVLLLTNDGELTQFLTHPQNNIEKIYIAKIKGKLDGLSIKKLTLGVIINGKKTSKSRVKIKKYDKESNTSIVELTIHEGAYHQVKNMFDQVGYEVIKLKREVFAGFTTAGLNAGEYRRLTVKEVKRLYSELNNCLKKEDK